jgi:hypothetical protein
MIKLQSELIESLRFLKIKITSLVIAHQTPGKMVRLNMPVQNMRTLKKITNYELT